MMRRVAIAVLGLGLAGCVGAKVPAADACGAAGLQNLIGQSRDVLAAMTLPQGTRVIEPGMPITEDYSETRLNIDLDAQGRIARVWCG
jgi:hypothetical protein